ncbi:MAG: glycine C-acetyltransferase [Ignavibacteriae bacterium]|nr:MAG: glycine C-acetyltransferase [Ignavibacteriota bacterium]
MYQRTKYDLKQELNLIKEAGLFKDERVILSDQKACIEVTYPPGSQAKKVLNFCSNNYLGLANHPKIIDAAIDTLKTHGFGLSSVRFICGTQDIHKKLEQVIADFYETDNTILYTSCFDANGGLFESILGQDDVIITDLLNHASIIDGIRLCKARRLIYDHSDMKSLEQKLQLAREGADIWDSTGLEHRPNPAKNIMIATDGVFSMDGDIAKLREIVDLAYKYDAMVMVDDSHATGFLGKHGRGALEYCGVLGEVDVITSTLGKAMGGASGGFTTGRREIIQLLRQRSRPYLFSNTVAPAIVGASLTVFEILKESDALREKLELNTKYFREKMKALGFDLIDSVHPIVPVLFRKFDNDAHLATTMSKELYNEGIYVIGFSYPVVPKGQARIRVQISAAHEKDHLDKCIEAFESVGKRLKVI